MQISCIIIAIFLHFKSYPQLSTRACTYTFILWNSRKRQNVAKNRTFSLRFPRKSSIHFFTGNGSWLNLEKSQALILVDRQKIETLRRRFPFLILQGFGEEKRPSVCLETAFWRAGRRLEKERETSLHFFGL